MAVKADDMSPVTGSRCPVCGAATVLDHRPFCSKRCADVDLARWLGGRYVIAGADRLMDEDSAEGIGQAQDAAGDPPDPQNER